MLIGGFNMAAASYEPAKKLLTEKYGQEEQIKAAHINAFYNLPAPAYNVKELKNCHALFSCSLNKFKVIETSRITLEELCTVLLAPKITCSQN